MQACTCPAHRSTHAMQRACLTPRQPLSSLLYHLAAAGRVVGLSLFALQGETRLVLALWLAGDTPTESDDPPREELQAALLNLLSKRDELQARKDQLRRAQAAPGI